MGYLERRNPAGGPGSERLHSNGRGIQPKYTPGGAPASFWQGWNGPQGMAPAINRKPPKPAGNTFWRPAKAGGQS